MTGTNSSLSTRVGVVLFQLGGPDSLDAIEPFLYNLFCDPDIIDFPFARLARQPLARLISSRRAGKVRKHYAEIGGKSPIGEVTARQARALEAELNKSCVARVLVAMRYWHPLTDAAISELTAFAPEEIVLLPLYPQYSRTTTGSSLNEWNRRFPKQQAARVHLVREFHNEPLYLDALVERIEQGLERFRRSNGHAARAPSDVHLLFSAHSIPISVVHGGDSYQAQIEATVKAVMERGRWANPHSLCYQSRSGPGRWLQPFIHEALQEITRSGSERVLVVPIAFVSDHVETLHEINIEARKIAENLGIQQFETMEGLNDSPAFITALADIVLRKVTVRVSD
ncbi:MAG: ferrochelatase [Acidobacteriota bacterium]|nr:ferrochelatase [Acidobacteriota bacterium]